VKKVKLSKPSQDESPLEEEEVESTHEPLDQLDLHQVEPLDVEVETKDAQVSEIDVQVFKSMVCSLVGF